MKITGDRATPRHPRRVICIDTESYVYPVEGRRGHKRHRFRLAVATLTYLRDGKVAYREVGKFTSQSDFWEWIRGSLGRRGSTWVVAHNLGYDLTMLGFWRLLDSGSITLLSAVLEDPPTHLVTLVGRCVVHWIDTLNYWRMPLSRLGESVGLPKLRMPEQSASDLDWYDYCQRDVEIVERSVVGLIGHVAASQMCSWQPTAPALAWRCFLTNFYRGGIYIHDDPMANEMERAAYYGGRVECFRLGQVPNPVYVVDANSLYPSVMVDRLYPTALLGHIHTPCRRDVDTVLMSYAAVAVVNVQTRDREYPIRLSRGPVWARGSFDTVLAGLELGYALASGDVSKVYDIWYYDQHDIFSGYVRYFAAARQIARAGGDHAGEMLSKLLLNSLHGKFGQRGRRWLHDSDTLPARRWGAWVDTHLATGERRKMRAIAGFAQRLEDRGESPHSFPGVSAYVTSYARIAVQEAARIAGPGNVFYQDTDCLHVAEAGYRSLNTSGVINPTQLGRYKLVCIGADAYYCGPKDYRVGEQVVCASIKSSAVPLGQGRYKQERWPGIAGLLQSGPAAGYETGEVVVALRRSRYADRDVKDGWIMPLFLKGDRHEGLRAKED